MEEVCEINSANEFSGWRTFLGAKCILLFPVEKKFRCVNAEIR